MKPKTRGIIKICIIVLFPLIFTIIFNDGSNEGINTSFIFAFFLIPLLYLTLENHSFFRSNLIAFGIVSVLLLITLLFWNYMDKPWFSPPEDFSCGGPCYGQFSINNPMPWLNFLGFSGIAFAIGNLTRFVLRKIGDIIEKTEKSRE